jgi:KDO2-lipid IV(A) lauroyltransferase
MDFLSMLSSKPVIQLGLLLGRTLPPRAGYGIGRAMAQLITRFKPKIYPIVQANLRQILGPEVDPAELDKLTYQHFLHAGIRTYDFFHAVGKSPDELARLVPIPAAPLMDIQNAQKAGKGVLILGIHLSNFDLAMLSFGSHGLPIQALSLADPQTGFRILNQLRAEAGFELTPITPRSLRQAVRRLKRGGIVMTAADWPDPADRELIPFFGRPAYLPLGPARLARLTGAVVFLGACRYTPEAGYSIEINGPVEMVTTVDRQADIYTNTCRLAEWMEVKIRVNPEQWMMFRPFWPKIEES